MEPVALPSCPLTDAATWAPEGVVTARPLPGDSWRGALLLNLPGFETALPSSPLILQCWGQKTTGLLTVPAAARLSLLPLTSQARCCCFNLSHLVVHRVCPVGTGQRLGGDGRGTASGWEGPGFHYLCLDPLSAVIVALPAWWFLAV